MSSAAEGGIRQGIPAGRDLVVTCGGTGESPLATLLFRHDLNDHEIGFVIMGMFYIITFHVSNLLFSEIFVLLFLAENAKSRTD